MKERDRKDEKKGMDKEKLRVFNSMIGPLVEYYGEDAVKEIDATQSKTEVAIRLSEVMNK